MKCAEKVQKIEKISNKCVTSNFVKFSLCEGNKEKRDKEKISLKKRIGVVVLISILLFALFLYSPFTTYKVYGKEISRENNLLNKNISQSVNVNDCQFILQNASSQKTQNINQNINVSQYNMAHKLQKLTLPVLMYHSILNSRQGIYIVSERQFENDLIELKKRGYTFVFPSEVINFLKGKGILPQKPIMITFDDGHYNNLHYGLPILQRQNAKAVENVIGVFSEYSSVSGDNSKPNYSHLTWEQVTALMDSGVFEIGNHSFDMHKYRPRYGMDIKNGENEEEYRCALRSDLSKLQDKLNACANNSKYYILANTAFNLSQNSALTLEYENNMHANENISSQKKPIQTLAFPFGKYNDTVIDEAKKQGFEFLLTCTEGVNQIEFGSFQNPPLIKRINRSGRYTTNQLIKIIEKYASAYK